MSVSSDVVVGNDILASDINDLREDVVNIATGHTHDGTLDDGKELAINATNFEYAANALAIKADGIDGSELNADCVDGVTIEQTGTTFNVKDGSVVSAKINMDITAQGTWALTTAPYTVPEGRYMAVSIAGNNWSIAIQVSGTWRGDTTDQIIADSSRYFVSDGTNTRLSSQGTTTVYYQKY